MRVLAISAAIAISMLTTAVHSNDAALSGQRFSISIRDQNVRDVFTELSAALGVPILISDAVSGRVSAVIDGGTARELLDRIADQRALDWRFDGRRIEVTARSEQTTRILDLSGVRQAELIDSLSALEVYQPQFRLTSVDGEFAMIVAPPSYIAIVEVVLGALVKRNSEARAASIEAEELAREARSRAGELARAEAAVALERQRVENERNLALERERNGQSRRSPRILRNGVWGG